MMWLMAVRSVLCTTSGFPVEALLCHWQSPNRCSPVMAFYLLTVSPFTVLWFEGAAVLPPLLSLLTAFFTRPCHLSNASRQLIHHLTDLPTHWSLCHPGACPSALILHSPAAALSDTPAACHRSPAKLELFLVAATISFVWLFCPFFLIDLPLDVS